MAAYEESEMFSTPFEFETAEPSSATILRELAAQRLLIESLRAEIGELRALLTKPSGPTIRLSPRRPPPVIDIDEDDETVPPTPTSPETVAPVRAPVRAPVHVPISVSTTRTKVKAHAGCVDEYDMKLAKVCGRSVQYEANFGAKSGKIYVPKEVTTGPQHHTLKIRPLRKDEQPSINEYTFSLEKRAAGSGDDRWTGNTTTWPDNVYLPPKYREMEALALSVC